MNSSPHVSSYFITFDSVSERTLDGDTLRIPGIETYEGIRTKTLIAFDYFLTRDSYDFIIRTNISSVWNYQALPQLLKDVPRTNVYSGTNGGCRGDVYWVSGAGILFTPDVCKKLVTTSFLSNEIDDVDIGYALHELGIPLTTHIPRHDVYSLDSVIPSGFHHYRIRLLPPPENVIENTISMMEMTQRSMLSIFG